MTTAICTLTKVQAKAIRREWKVPSFATGLPVVDEAAERISAVDTEALKKRLGILPRSKGRVISLALGKAEAECLRAIEAVTSLLRGSRLLVARVHPALPESGRAEVAARLSRIRGALSLERAMTLSPWEAMALAKGYNLFVAAHASTMLAQAAAAGIRAAALPPEGGSAKEWGAARLPLLHGGHIALLSSEVFSFTPSPLPHGGAVKASAEVVLSTAIAQK